MLAKNIFNTKYPIVCAPMNQVSDFNLAMAVAEEGCFPTFVVFNLSEVIKYKKATGSTNFSIFLDLKYMTEEECEIIKDINPKFIEFIYGGQYRDRHLVLESPRVKGFIDFLKKNNTTVIFKTTAAQSQRTNENEQFYSVYNIKGSESAGCIGVDTTKEAFLKQKAFTPNMPICMSGGIYTGQQVDWYLENGATAVYMGTPFAMTFESSIATTVKLSMVYEKKNQRETIVDFDGLKRNGIIFNKENYKVSKNNLKTGVNGIGGHVFVGQAIDQINKIKSVKEVVQQIVDESVYLKNL